MSDGAPKGDFATTLAGVVVGAIVLFWFSPIHLLRFIVRNRFYVTTKTWVYFIIIATIITLIGLGSLFSAIFAVS